MRFATGNCDPAKRRPSAILALSFSLLSQLSNPSHHTRHNSCAYGVAKHLSQLARTTRARATRARGRALTFAGSRATATRVTALSRTSARTTSQTASLAARTRTAPRATATRVPATTRTSARPRRVPRRSTRRPPTLRPARRISCSSSWTALKANLVTGTLGFGTCMAAPTSPPTDAPLNPCGKPCKEDKDCNGNGGFFGNTCLVGGTRCAGHCAKRD